MDNAAFYFLLLTISCIFIQAFFAMFEMASVSFNKVRLHYYVSLDNKRAKWLSFLLDKPSRLFGTTLISVNTVMQIGSECSRRFYDSVGLNPDYAPISQVFIVLIFGELAPLFAARRHSEQVAMVCVPIVYALYFVLKPFTYLLGKISSLITSLSDKNKDMPLTVSRDELQRAFEDKTLEEGGQLNVVIENIFSVKKKSAKDLMIPIENVQKISSQAKVQDLRHLLSVNFHSFIPIFHRSEENIVGLVYSRDLLKTEDDKRIADYTHPPWFIADDAQILEILKQFRTNNQSIAIVLSSSGQATGILTLDQIVSYLFGEQEFKIKEEKKDLKPFIERTLSGEMLIEDFNTKFQTNIIQPNCETLSDLVYFYLKHHPVKGESIKIDRFEMIVLEPSLLGAKTVLVRTIF